MHLFAFLLLLASAPGLLHAQASTSKTLNVYPGAVPGALGHADADRPTIDVYLPASNPTHTAVLVIPGGSYTLEVSSPGIERRLVKPQDFTRFAGKKAKITLKEPIDQRRNFEGKLAGFEDGAIALETAPGQTLRVPFANVQKANLKFEW